ncbi:DNA-binding response regulator, OmpR family [endosymbiont of Ridgeia piscesae]|uniref:DNA-binding response regulator, OmpR family n=3 Tax=endosymbiont of Ridgeia piscesae TaxID=54398 RepID=A0A0T5YZ55_9GAMM|nr:response regulator transcription factor [endosymbiont of Ridgeia piscesae]KRT55897.1 DNA-binding response regulator, OmpR family [endosymbiont of Ridgeia piscesae]
MRLLLVEDDALLGDGLKTILSLEGHSVDWVKDGRAADANLAGTAYEAVVLDLNLPYRSGLQILEQLRRQRNQVPVIIITARDQIQDRVCALDNGADDYLVKPFDTDELCARLRAMQRRFYRVVNTIIEHDNIQLDLSSHRLEINGIPVTLSPREFTLLQVLLENAGRVLSRQRLIESLYGWDDSIDSNAVEVFIHHLRKKVGPGLIRTVRGIGYLIERPGCCAPSSGYPPYSPC